MSSSRYPTRERLTRARGLALGAAVAAMVATTLGAAPAQSVADPNCPSPVLMSGVTKGMPVDGLTVSSGRNPDHFTGEVLGVLQDGIAPGLDMIMVRLQGSEITDANGNVDKGIWAGMSGSPVYAANGRLLGAVAYGLSWSPSDVAGVTPAVQMEKLLSGSMPRTAREKAVASKRIAVPPRFVRNGEVSTAQASSGFHRLPMPMNVSGLSNRHLQKVAKKFGVKGPLVVGGRTSASAPPSDIVPGGNLGATLSYGDITYGGIGTATAVCGNEVLAFGHPMMWSGRTTLFMHGADAIYIQKDAVFGSFKVANLDGPSGAINQDRLAGIRGVVGEFPQQTDVTSFVTAANGNARHGKTVIAYRPETPYISAIHLLSNADRVLDQVGSGSARVRWIVDGTRADGSAWHYSRVDRFASRWDITYSTIYEPYRQLSQMLHNNFERVHIDSVHFRASYSPKFAAMQIAKFELYLHGHWVTITSHRPAKKVLAGTDLPVRVTLEPTIGTGSAKVVRLTVHVPKHAKGQEGVLYVSGGGSGGKGQKATSFDELLVKLANAPRNDELSATLRTGTSKGGGKTDVDSQVVPDVVSGNKHVHLIVR